MQRLTIPEIVENEWFQKDYVPTCGNDIGEKIYLDDVNAAFDSIEVRAPHDCNTSKMLEFLFESKNLICYHCYLFLAGESHRDQNSKILEFYKCIPINSHVK